MSTQDNPEQNPSMRSFEAISIGGIGVAGTCTVVGELGALMVNNQELADSILKGGGAAVLAMSALSILAHGRIRQNQTK